MEDKHPDMQSSCKYTEKALVNNRQWVLPPLGLGGWITIHRKKPDVT
jgi:hypothetical protein